MKNPFQTEEAEHWYTQTGAPRYEANLRIARKENLLPSITTTLKIYPKASLDRWIKEQGILARHNNPPPPEAEGNVEKVSEASDAHKIYFRHIEDLSNQIRDRAGDRGNDIHAGIEAMLLGKKWDETDPHLIAVRAWLDENLETVHFTEKSVVDLELGVGGRLDACVQLKDSLRPIILDYKGRGFDHGPRKGWKAARRKTDLIQLAFYAHTMADPPRIANLYVANNQAEGIIEFVEYSDDERIEAIEVLKHLVAVWRYEKKYRPVIDHEAVLEYLEGKAA